MSLKIDLPKPETIAKYMKVPPQPAVVPMCVRKTGIVYPLRYETAEQRLEAKRASARRFKKSSKRPKARDEKLIDLIAKL